MSLVFICRENTRRLEIFLFPNCPRFCRLMKARNRRYPRLSGKDGDKSGNRERFYFSVASQISPIFSDGVAMDFAHYQSLKLLGSSPPIIRLCTNFNFWGTFHFLPNSIPGESGTDFLRLSDTSALNWGWSAKGKIPNRLGFSRHMKTRL